jgi:lipoprotein-anchoring transpeptidase ErfK/SrfK
VDFFQVYDTQTVDQAEWNMIGPNEWVEARKVAVVHPNTTPPDGVTNGRWIDVDLAEQTLAVYDNYRLVFATVIASGLEPFWTRPGLFQIYQKKATETMRNSDPTDYYYLDNVPWTMYFDKARALHGAYWRTRFGYPQSHGCINLSVGDAHWLFNWAVEGDWVHVHDPTGLTPTDPALYHDWAY